MYCEIKLGTKCNNNCIFCLNKNKDLEKNKESIFRQIQKIEEHDVDEIQLTGGEPTIRKDFYQICKHIKEKGFNLIIQTNGRMFSYPKFTKKITKLGITKICVSLHSHNEELNSIITRSKNSFNQTIKGIKNLVELKQFVIINCVINKKNIIYLDEIARLINTLNVNQVQLSWVRPQGKAKQNIEVIVPKYEEGIQKIKEFHRLVDNKKTQVFIMGVPKCLFYDKNINISYTPNGVGIVDNQIIIDTKNKRMEERMTKNKECEKCSINSLCEGINKEYYLHYGGNIIKAIK